MDLRLPRRVLPLLLESERHFKGTERAVGDSDGGGWKGRALMVAWAAATGVLVALSRHNNWPLYATVPPFIAAGLLLGSLLFVRPVGSAPVKSLVLASALAMILYLAA